MEIKYPNWLPKIFGSPQTSDEMNGIVEVLQNHAETLSLHDIRILAASSGIYTDSLTPTSEVPAEVGDKVFLVTQPGTYTNFGNVVLPENNFGFIFKNGNNFSIQSVEMPMQDLTVIENKIDEVQSNINSLGISLEHGASDVITPNKDIKIWTESDVLNYEGFDIWFTGIESKSFNVIGIPIIRGFEKIFTDGIKVQIAVNNVWIKKEIRIPFSEVEKFNTIPLTNKNIDELFYYISLPSITINNGDIVFIGLRVENPLDKLGFVYTQTLENEWADGKGGVDLKQTTTIYETPPPRVSNPNQYIVRFLESSNDIVGDKINKALSTKVNSKYFSTDVIRDKIAPFLDKLRLRKDVNIVCYGNSITQFQNSETLTNSEQQVNPIGLSANSWVRNIYKKLNYIDSDIVFRRFDHLDFTFSNGIQTTSNPIGSNGWATNRNDAEAWRGNDVGGVFAQKITEISSYNKPIVGTNKVGEKFSITIPSNATKLDITFIQPQLSKSVKIKIGNVIDETIVLNQSNNTPTEVIKTYTFEAGTSKLLEVTNIDSDNFWFYGVSWRTKNYVRVINSGSGGYNINLLSEDWKFNPQVKNYNPDLVVFEVCSSNDVNLESFSLVSHYEKAESLFNKLKLLNVPVIIILTHRFTEQFINRDKTSIAIQDSVKFVPELIKNYRALAHKYDFGLIDIFSKSIDMLGNENVITPPENFFLDAGHLAKLGNQMYNEEIDNVFLIHDFA